MGGREQGNVLRSFPVDAHRGLDAKSALKALKRVDRRLERRSTPEVVLAVAHIPRFLITACHGPYTAQLQNTTASLFHVSTSETSQAAGSGRHQR